MKWDEKTSEGIVLDTLSKTEHASCVRHRLGTLACILAILFGLSLFVIPNARDAIAEEHALDGGVVSVVRYGDDEIPVVETYGATRAPEGHVAGLWMDDTCWPRATNRFRYIIGHNPGAFSFVEGMRTGERFEVDGREYVVRDVFDVEKGTYYDEVEPYVSGIQDCVILQACVDFDQRYRVAVAAPVGSR